MAKPVEKTLAFKNPRLFFIISLFFDILIIALVSALYLFAVC